MWGKVCAALREEGRLLWDKEWGLHMPRKSTKSFIRLVCTN